MVPQGRTFWIRCPLLCPVVDDSDRSAPTEVRVDDCKWLKLLGDARREITLTAVFQPMADHRGSGFDKGFGEGLGEGFG